MGRVSAHAAEAAGEGEFNGWRGSVGDGRPTSRERPAIASCCQLPYCSACLMLEREKSVEEHVGGREKPARSRVLLPDVASCVAR